MKTKSSLRQEFRLRRQQLPSAYRQAAASAASKFFVEQLFFKQSQHIACYLPFQDEFDSVPLIETIWQAKKQCYLPILAPLAKNFLCFVRYQHGDALKANRYGILEPLDCSEQALLGQLGLIIAPLIAFDALGNRLGTGGGYYDRSLAADVCLPRKRPLFIGLGYAIQQAPILPADEWDVPLDGVLTENGYLMCRKAS